jgi:hypothetical protein
VNGFPESGSLEWMIQQVLMEHPDWSDRRIARAVGCSDKTTARPSARMLGGDECARHLRPVVRAMWMKGPRVRVPTPGTNARCDFFGALDAASGRFHGDPAVVVEPCHQSTCSSASRATSPC